MTSNELVLVVSVVTSAVGWVVIFFVHMSAVQRAEASRLKDRVIDDSYRLITWSLSEEPHFKLSAENKENTFSIMVTQIEIQRKELMSRKLGVSADSKVLLFLRDLDVSQTELSSTRESFQSEVVNSAGDIIREVEDAYNEFFKKRNFLKRLSHFFCGGWGHDS